MSSISVAVISYNTREQLRACLTSVVASHPRDVIVGDNGSTDGTLELVRDAFPTVELLVDYSNPGYGSASNAAIARCRGDHVLLLNSDTIIAPDTLDVLRAHLDAHPRAGIVGPRLRNADGTLQRSIHQFPNPAITLLDYSWLGPTLGLIPGLRKLYLASDAHDRARPVPWITGAALAIRRSAFDAVGGFDPSFFMYYEEVDLSYRMSRLGWETHFTPATDVIHLGGASTGQQRAAMYLQQIEAAIQYSNRHHPPLSVLLTKGALRFALACRLVGDTMRLQLARDPGSRARLRENVAMLRPILARRWPAAAR